VVQGLIAGEDISPWSATDTQTCLQLASMQRHLTCVQSRIVLSSQVLQFVPCATPGVRSTLLHSLTDRHQGIIQGQGKWRAEAWAEGAGAHARSVGNPDCCNACNRYSTGGFCVLSAQQVLAAGNPCFFTAWLQQSRCSRLCSCMSMQGACDTSYALELSQNRRATISEFRAEPRVDLREYYEVGVVLMKASTYLHVVLIILIIPHNTDVCALPLPVCCASRYCCPDVQADGQLKPGTQVAHQACRVADAVCKQSAATRPM
jgi:Transcriptional Coactivator p15 (PC4)